MAAKLARTQRTSPRDGPAGGKSLLKVGDLLAGKYRVESILGEGGMGVVVAAYHELLDQHVAVKLLYQDVADREAQSRLLLEARSAAKLQSEHVARVIDVDTGADGLPFIVMELLEGADLCQIADARGALPRWLVVDYILQALEGLAHAHVRGIIHRDLKPSNLFLANKADGTQIIKILDFGISKSQEQPGDRRQQQLTGGRSVLGSPPYMSPEQVRSPKTVDSRTDIWSLGICMYELLTNSMPFGGDEIQETFAQVLENQPTPIRQLVTGVPEGLEQVVMRCLAKKRDERWSDVGELARALAPYGSGTWIQSADRVTATLARPFSLGLDDTTSGMRLKNSGPQHFGLGTPQQMAIPGMPGKRLDSLQPELTGTASTVARRFGFDSNKRWLIVAALAVPAVVGVGLIGLTMSAKARQGDAAAASASAEPPPDPVTVATPATSVEVTPAGPATSVVTTGNGQASPENELPNPAPAGTLIGVSPTAPKSKPAAYVAKPAAQPSPAPNPYPAKKPPPTSGTARPALPPGLPLTRQ
jgi:eukaryotic-like serine/threonine-protein kinase